jgi:nucleotide-binding universal stress UspA family protein
MRSPRRILVPVDFSPCSAAALQYAANLAEQLDAQVDVLHVWQSPQLAFADGTIPPLTVFAHTQAGQAMSTFLEELEAGGMPADRVRGRLASGDAATRILEVAEEGGYDLIVMGRHGRGRLQHFLVGSVTEKVSRKAPTPVLTLHRPSEPLALSRNDEEQDEARP